MHPSTNIVTTSKAVEISKSKDNPRSLNSYNSLNRANRIKEIARVGDDNKKILGRLQETKSNYNADAW